MSHRHVCVHGHFYQPPRENPWTGAVDREESASPFHDWNSRIAEECYGPVTLGVRAGDDGLSLSYDETLKRLSFNFGPTLLSWLERERPSILARVVAADKAGRGAMAQPYFHNILPLEPRRDKETLVRWGLAEFKARFGREADGVWLPETAVDDETLDVLAAEGVRFTILDPAQSEAVRDIGASGWTKPDAEHVDPKTPYVWTSPLDPARTLAVFFYHRRLSRGIVTGETVASAGGFADAVRHRLMPNDAAQLAFAASDGEFYGHHHPGAERVLAGALDLLEADGVPPTTPAKFLALFPPPHEVKVRANTAWSCEHGLGRWERDCGCRSAHLPEWTQEWRGPLRDALRKLAQRLDAFYEDDASRFFEDPWKVRDEAVLLWLPGAPSPSRFLAERAKRPLLAADETRVMALLAMQRERLAMFTSCGWFFDDVSGLEAVQVLQRAARALELAKSLGEDAEAGFVERLAACRSNLPRFKDGAGVWRKLVLPSRVDARRAAAHAALLSHLGMPAPEPPLLRWELGPAFRADKKGLAGKDRSLSCRPVVVSRPGSGERAEVTAVVHRADRLDLSCWVVEGPVDAAALGAELLAKTDDELRASLDSRFGPPYGLDALLSDDRGEAVKALASESALGPARAAFLRRWVECVGALRLGAQDDDLLLELLAEAPAHSFAFGELPWIRALEERLHERLEAVVASPRDAALISRAMRWLDALWDAGLIAGAWRLRDAQARWDEALRGEPASAAGDACRALGLRLGLADRENA